VLVVLAGDSPEAPSSVALEDALHAALGSGAVVSIRRSGYESEEALAHEAAATQATLLCVVGWRDDARRVTIRFLRPEEGHWSDREIRFDGADAPAERGRTVGFALASMVPDEALAQHGSEEPPPAPTPSGPRVAEPAAETPTAPPVPSRTALSSIEIAAHGAVGIGGAGGGLGGVVGARIGLSRAWRLRFAIGARLAELDQAQATSRSYFAGGGVAWFTPLDAASRWGLGARLDVLALGEEVVHLSADDPAPDHLFRVLPGAAAAVEGTWRFAEQSSIIAAVGSEVAFGRTTVVVHDRQVAEIVPIRPLAELGLRVDF
jgi:hypothetical protein